MKKLKIILQSNYLYLLLVILVIFYIFLFKPISKFKGDEKNIKGYVYYIKIDGDKLTLKIKSKENILVNYYFKSLKEKNNFNIKYGDYLDIYGQIEEAKENTNFNLFNYKKYLLSEKIYYVYNSKKIIKLKNNSNLFYSFKNLIIDRIDKCKLTKNFIKTFVIGDKNDIDYNFFKATQNLGIIHLFTISGMHVSLIILVINKIIKNEKTNFLITISFLLLYIFLTNFQISIIRASILFLYLKLKINLPFNKFLILFVSLLLFYNPFYIYNIGFKFSIIISFYLINFKELIKNSKFKLFKTSLISFLSSFPLIINNFYQINFISIFVNIIFIPIISYFIFPISILCFIFPKLDLLYNYVIFYFEKIIIYIDNIKIFKFSFAKISLLLIIIYYIFLFLCIKSKKYFKCVFLLILIFYIYNYYSFNPILYSIDVSQGDSFLIKYKNKNIMIDTGGITSFNKEKWREKSKKYDLCTNTIIPFLQSVGVKKIDYLILSHGDYDHMGEAINLVNNFKVEKVIFNCGPYNNLEKELIKVLDKKKIKYYSCIKELNIDKNKLYFLQTKEYDNENDNSNIIYTELNDYKFMFMGDASSTTEEEILSKYNLPNIDILKVGHHGSKTSSSKEFINEINPKYSIISVGKNNRYGHPSKEALESLKESKIYRTDQDGSIMFKIKNNKLQIETCSP